MVNEKLHQVLSEVAGQQATIATSRVAMRRPHRVGTVCETLSHEFMVIAVVRPTAYNGRAARITTYS